MSSKKRPTLSYIVVNTLVALNVLAVFLMLFLGNADMINPATHPKLSILSLFFPFTIPVCFVFIFLWLIVRKRYALISVAGLLLAYSPIRSYCPLNMKKQVPDSCLTILSYNVMMFDVEDHKDHDNNPIVDYIVDSNADIVCLQETGSTSAIYDNLSRKMKQRYPYNDSIRLRHKNDVLTLYSKYKILKAKMLRNNNSEINLSVAYDLLVDGDTVVVINSHLESTHLSSKDKKQFDKLVKGKLQRDSAQRESRNVLSKLANSNRERAAQIDSIAAFIDHLGDIPIILCGDFNDHPNSYTHRQIAQRLTDCYREAGCGAGFSYQRGGIYERIDHIFCSAHFTPYRCYVDKTIDVSDHYPIISKLKKRHKSSKKR